MGDFCEKSDFSPLKVENTQNIFQKSEKNSLAGPGPVGKRVNNMEKNFFAFLDELDHLEAKNKYYFLVENEGHFNPPPLQWKLSTKRYFLFFMPPLMDYYFPLTRSDPDWKTKDQYRLIQNTKLNCRPAF